MTHSENAAWHWARTARTRRALLDAAREVFTEQGFASSSTSELVRRAGSSVGSLYHHFGGKTEVFFALWREQQAAYEEAVSAAVAQARRAGVADPFELFAVSARAFLASNWRHRDLALLFLEDDSIPGFSATQRRLGQEWVVRHFARLPPPGDPFGGLRTAILASLVDEGAREVAVAADSHQADLVIEAVVEYLSRVMANWPPVSPGRKA